MCAGCRLGARRGEGTLEVPSSARGEAVATPSASSRDCTSEMYLHPTGPRCTMRATRLAIQWVAELWSDGVMRVQAAGARGLAARGVQFMGLAQARSVPRHWVAESEIVVRTEVEAADRLGG